MITLCMFTHYSSEEFLKFPLYNVIYARLLWVTVMTDDDFTPVKKFLIDVEKLNWSAVKKLMKKITEFS